MSLPEEHKSSIISNGLHFMRSITEAYGTDTGLELWEQITKVLDPEVKGQIFFAMITGTYNNRIELRDIGDYANAVACIKEIRQWTGLGLKEAKDVYDRVRHTRAKEWLTVKPSEYPRAVAGLRSVGFNV